MPLGVEITFVSIDVCHSSLVEHSKDMSFPFMQHRQ